MQRNCSDPKSIFGDFDTLQACYDEFGGNPSNSTFAHLVSACVNDYCNSPFPWIGGCATWQGPTEHNFAVRETAFFLSRFTYFDSPAACEGVVGDPSSDIAGPGVYTSYMIQMAFILFLWFLIQVSSAIIKINRHLRLPERPVLRAWRHRFPTGARLLHRIFHRHHAVLKHTLIEFHEAQCFFLIAAQLAILIAQGDAAVLGSYTLRSALQNMTTSYLVSTIGILPVVIAMWSLQMEHEFCACTMLLSVTTVALSEAAMYKSKGLSVRGQMATVDYRGWPASCGGHAPPLIYCGLATEGTGPIAFPSAFLKASNPICLTIFGVTVLLWVRRRLLGLACVNRSADLSLGRLVSVVLTRPPVPPFLSHVVRPLTFCLKPLADCALFTVVVVSMQVFSQYTNLIDWKGWSFGQVVAVTLWFPVICKYCYWLCMGTDAFSKMRIPSPYRIINTADDTNSSAVVPASPNGSAKSGCKTQR